MKAGGTVEVEEKFTILEMVSVFVMENEEKKSLCPARPVMVSGRLCSCELIIESVESITQCALYINFYIH